MPSVVFGWVRGPATLVAREALNGAEVRIAVSVTVPEA